VSSVSAVPRRLSGEDAGVISIVRDHDEKALRACWRVFPTLHRPEELIYILDVLDAEWQGALATGLDWWVETGPIGGWKSGYCSALDQVPHRVIGGCWGSQVWGMIAGCRLPGVAWVIVLHGSS